MPQSPALSRREQQIMDAYITALVDMERERFSDAQQAVARGLDIDPRNVELLELSPLIEQSMKKSPPSSAPTSPSTWSPNSPLCGRTTPAASRRFPFPITDLVLYGASRPIHAAAIREARIDGVVELIPELASLLVSYAPERIAYDDLIRELAAIRAGIGAIARWQQMDLYGRLRTSRRGGRQVCSGSALATCCRISACPRLKPMTRDAISSPLGDHMGSLFEDPSFVTGIASVDVD